MCSPSSRSTRASFGASWRTYRWADNLHRLNRLRWVMETSLLQTLARKLGISVSQVSRRDKTTIQTERGPKVALQVTIEREGKKPLAATWGSTSLARKMGTVLNDDPRPFQNLRTEIVDRLLADACELCGSHDHVQVHHIKALKDLRHEGRTPKPTWIRTMAARQRKKLVVCRECHVAIHAGRPTRTHGHNHRALESRVP